MKFRGINALLVIIALLLITPIHTFAGGDLSQRAVLTTTNSSYIQQERVSTEEIIYGKKRKKKKKKKKRNPVKIGRKFFSKTCALSGCHGANDPSRFAGYTSDMILTLGFDSVPLMMNLKRPSKKALKNLVAYFATLE